MATATYYTMSKIHKNISNTPIRQSTYTIHPIRKQLERQHNVQNVSEITVTVTNQQFLNIVVSSKLHFLDISPLSCPLPQIYKKYANYVYIFFAKIYIRLEYFSFYFPPALALLVKHERSIWRQQGEQSERYGEKNTKISILVHVKNCANCHIEPTFFNLARQCQFYRNLLSSSTSDILSRYLACPAFAFSA